MSHTIQNYPVKPALPKIDRHDQLPEGSDELGRLLDTSVAKDLYVFLKRGKHLSILKSYENTRTGKYYCKQFDFPLKVLSWFPKALEDFRRPPAEGGLHAGAMTSSDENVDGEMLCVQAATQGYYLVNWSRQDQQAFDENYEPTQISLGSHFLYDLGLLDFWKELGEKYANGQL